MKPSASQSTTSQCVVSAARVIILASIHSCRRSVRASSADGLA